LLNGGQARLLELEARLKQETGAPTLKIRFTRVFGYYIEVSRAQATRVPSTFKRKQTVATGERYTMPELDELAERIARAETDALAREAELFEQISNLLLAFTQDFRSVATRLSELDVIQSLAEVAHRNDYCRPEVDTSSEILIEEGRHAVVERMTNLGRFVPNDCMLESAASLWLVTGPNMAGKSTFMRQVALIVVLAQMGSFVPAKKARIGLVDQVLTRVGASDSLARGESTFMVEMRETATVLASATHRSLVILDEIGRGTSTYDGLSIAWSVAEHLASVTHCRTLFATHYHELTKLSLEYSNVANVSVSAREHEGSLIFMHRLERTAASRSYGVACAKLAGLPTSVLLRAERVLAELEDTPKRVVRVALAQSPQLVFPLALSDPGAEKVFQALKAVKTDALTPLAALNLLVAWQEEFVLRSKNRT
jgi:DNA mismatch repair protein MutS